MMHPVMSNKIFVNDLMSLCSPFKHNSYFARSPDTNDYLSNNKENESTNKREWRRKFAGRRQPLTQKRVGGRGKRIINEPNTEPMIKAIDFLTRLNEDIGNIVIPIDHIGMSPDNSTLKKLPR